MVRIATALSSIISQLKEKKRPNAAVIAAQEGESSSNGNSSSSTAKKQDRPKTATGILASKVKKLFKQFNINGTGKMDKGEFEHMLVFLEEEHRKLQVPQVTNLSAAARASGRTARKKETDTRADAADPPLQTAARRERERESSPPNPLIPVPHYVCILMMFHCMEDSEKLLPFKSFKKFIFHGKGKGKKGRACKTST
jgi:hypothetical protein